MNAGTHVGAPNEKRVDQRMTGRSQPGVGMGRRLGLGMVDADGKQLILKLFENFALAQFEGGSNFLKLC